MPSPFHLPGCLADSFQCNFPWVVVCSDGVLEPFTVFLTSRLVSHWSGEFLLHHMSVGTFRLTFEFVERLEVIQLKLWCIE
jgi:hypothetical protein